MHRLAAAAAVVAPVRSAAALVLDQTVKLLAATLDVTEHDNPVRRPGRHRHHVHLGSLDRDNHPLMEVAVGRSSGLGSLSWTMGEEGTGSGLDLAGLGESPSVVRVRRRCRCFVVGACRLGYSEEVEDSCFVKGC